MYLLTFLHTLPIHLILFIYQQRQSLSESEKSLCVPLIRRIGIIRHPHVVDLATRRRCGAHADLEPIGIADSLEGRGQRLPRLQGRVGGIGRDYGPLAAGTIER